MARLVFASAILGSLLGAVSHSSLSAQVTVRQPADSLSSTNGAPPRIKEEHHLVSGRDAMMFAGAALATASIVPFDHDIQRAFRSEDMRDNGGLRRSANALAFTGGPGPFVIGGALYMVGEAGRSPRLATLGVTMAEGVVLAAALNGVVKGVTGRALPNATTVEPGDFSFGRGFHDRNGSFVSFPSGHTAASFAAAAVVASEVSEWNPSAARVVTPTAYSLATLVALSRLYENVHWASDLPLGAAIGIWSGKTAVAWQNGHPNNWLIRQLVHFQVAPTSHGLTIGATFDTSHR